MADPDAPRLTTLPPRSDRVLLGLVLLVAARLVLAGHLGVLADEAYYWTWSKQLAAGYFDHPPAVAWLIAAGTRLFGDSVLGVRVTSVVAGGLAAAVLLPWARDRALWLLLVAVTPLFALGGLFATPDVPLLLGWSIALAGALSERWLLAGLGVGLASLGKLTGWGLWPLLFLATPREWRRMLPGILLTLLVIAPNLAWQHAHGWPSLRFQLGHGLGEATRETPGLGGVASFVVGQVGVVTPVVLVAAIVAAWKGRHGERTERILTWTSLPALAFFAFASTRAHGEPNWTAGAWVGAMLLLARSDGRLHRAAWVGCGLAACLTGLVLVHAVTPLVQVPNDPVARLDEGAVLAQSVEAWGVPVVYTERYQEAALLRFHRGLAAYALPGVGRPDQFDLWEVPDAEGALFVRPWRGGPSLPTDAVCAERGPSNDVAQRDAEGNLVARWQVVEVGGCVLPRVAKP